MSQPALSRVDKLRRLFVGVCILGIGLLAIYLWASNEAEKPYRSKTIGDVTLNVPTLYLPDGQQDLNEMVRDYVVSVSGKLQLSAYADEILSGIPLDQTNRASEITWTIEPAKGEAHQNGVLESDILLFTGGRKYSERSVSGTPEGGLYFYRKDAGEARYYSVSRLPASETFSVDPAFAHCIDFHTVQLSGPKGRCSTHFITNTMIVRAHYSRDLAWHTPQIRQRLWQMIESWKEEK